MKQIDEETKIAAFIVAEAFVHDLKKLEGASGMEFIAPRSHTPRTALYAVSYVFDLLSPCVESLRKSDRKRVRLYARFQLTEMLFRKSLPHRTAIVCAFSALAKIRSESAQTGT